MKKVVIYKRVSSEVQSFDRQEADAIEFARRNDLEVVEIFEEKISGSITTKNRPALVECMNYILNPVNNINGLVISELSRLGRNNLDVLTNIQHLNDASICVYSISQNLITLNADGSVNSNTALLLNILSSIAEQERIQLINRVNSGILTSVSKNYTSGAGKYNAYGYKKVDKKYVIEEEEAKVVKLIFDKYINTNMGITAIANYLNEQKIQTRYSILKMDNYRQDYSVNHFNFSASTVSNILKRNLYTGKRIYNQKNKKGEIINTIINTDETIRIITDDDFKLANDKLKSKINTIGSHNKFNYILDNSTIFCGLCQEKGFKHVYYPIKRLSTKSSYYKCGFIGKYDNTEKNCDNYRIGIEKLTSSVWFFLRRTDKLLEQIQKSQNSNSIETKIIEYNNKIEATNNELRLLENEEQKLLNLHLKDIISISIYTDKYSQLKNRKEKYQNAVITFNDELIALKELQLKLNNLPEQLRLIKGSPFMMKELVQQLVRQIIIYPVKSENVLYSTKKGTTKELYIELYLNTQEEPIKYLISQYNWLILPLIKGEFNKKTKMYLPDRIKDRIKLITHKVEIQTI